MTDYTHDHVVVYAELAGALRLARSARAFVTDTVTGLPVDVTQGARTAAYVDTDADGRATFTATTPTRLRLTSGATFLDVWPIEVAGPDDATVAGLLGSASATRAAADARYVQGTAVQDITHGGTGATTAAAARTALGLGSVDNTTDLAKPVSTATAASIAALQAQSASIEDLFVNTSLQTTGGAWANTADVSAPIFSAPFPLTVTSVALLTWSGAAIALSDTAYWRAVVRKANVTNTVVTDVAYKTTRVTASAPYPAGQVWTPRVAWTFDAAAFTGATLAVGETLYLATLPVGTPGAIAGAFTATVGYRPL